MVFIRNMKETATYVETGGYTAPGCFAIPEEAAGGACGILGLGAASPGKANLREEHG